jgi:hypothetical protein
MKEIFIGNTLRCQHHDPASGVLHGVSHEPQLHGLAGPAPSTSLTPLSVILSHENQPCVNLFDSVPTA